MKYPKEYKTPFVEKLTEKAKTAWGSTCTNEGPGAFTCTGSGLTATDTCNPSGASAVPGCTSGFTG